MLRKSVPLRGPYVVGNMVSFLRRGKWYGPARVIAHEGKSSLWLLHHGVTVLVAETSCRPATAEELYKKQVLEMRPSRKRRRQIVSDDPDDDIYIPFTDDLQGAFKEEGQIPFVDIQTDAQPDQLMGGVAANPPSSEQDLWLRSSTALQKMDNCKLHQVLSLIHQFHHHLHLMIRQNP